MNLFDGSLSGHQPGAKKPQHKSKANGHAAGWMALCQKSPRGDTPLSNLHNVLLALRLDPAFLGAFRYDEMRRVIIGLNGKIKDRDVACTREWLQAHGLSIIGTETVRDAIDIVSGENAFHPLRDWLDGLEWDGQLRLTDWLHTYLGAEDNEYHRSIGSMFLTAMVARAFKPGIQADYMMVLEGPQGELKSQACRVLGGEYYSSDLPDLHSDPVRVAMHLRGKWLIEISELSAFSRADGHRLKAFITNQCEQFIPKYARYEVDEPRTCLFIGTTNDDDYLKDETGGRRFWPVKCGNINIEALRSNRAQIYAEAVMNYRRDAHWWPDRPFEAAHIAPQQAARLMLDAWHDPVREWLIGKNRTSLMDVAQGALSFEKARFSSADQRRLATVLRQLGWKLRRLETARVWEPAP
jgi:predicted P-loop ATPase